MESLIETERDIIEELWTMTIPEILKYRAMIDEITTSERVRRYLKKYVIL